MNRYYINDQYFNWLSNMVCENRFAREISYNKLLMSLHEADFRYLILMDKNRAADGLALRYKFAIHLGYEDDPEIVTDYLDGPCSVLEMMVGLALHCEEHIMDDPRYGNRFGQWFWGMVANLGLGGMTDNRFDRRLVDEAIARLLDRDYEPDGSGGLFTIRNCPRDLRSVEIFHQMCWYLNSID